MNKNGILLALFLTTALLYVQQQARAQGTIVGTGLVDYFGYPNCIKLENENTRVILNVHGGRVLEYSWKGGNGIYLNPEQEGWTRADWEPREGPTGGRLDIGPENVIPAHPDLWLGAWTGEIIGPRRARLTSVEDEPTGTQLIREFSLDESSSRLTCRQIIKNVSVTTKEWCHWSRTFAPGGGIVIIPLTPNSRFPRKYVMYGPGPVMNFRPQDPNIRVRDDFLEIMATPQQPKLGIDSHAGWFSYLMPNDLMFVKRFPTYPDRVYNEMAAFTISIWYYKNQMCELEPIGPRERIAPGESSSFTEEWWLLPWKFPEQRNAVDLSAVEQLVREQAR